MSNIKYCEYCDKNGDAKRRILKCGQKEVIATCISGFLGFAYFERIDKDAKVCPFCGNPIVDTEIDIKDFTNIAIYSNYNRQAIEALIKLKKNEPLEYEIKAMPFREASEKNNNDSYIPRCPTCGSTNIEKISFGKKLTGGVLFGLLSSNVRKTMHCRNCGYKW